MGPRLPCRVAVVESFSSGTLSHTSTRSHGGRSRLHLSLREGSEHGEETRERVEAVKRWFVHDSKVFNLAEPRGALIGSVELNSPAAHAGLEVGDVIVRVDGQEVTEQSDLRLVE